MRLVADIGGTNARLALCENGVIDPKSVKSFVNDDWQNLYDVIHAFLEGHAVTLEDMVIAVAGPVHIDRATLTNRNWVIKSADLARIFGCQKAALLNDLSALGYAVPALKSDQLCKIYDDEVPPTDTGQFLVVGLGTGFNVSPVLKTRSGVYCLAAEAGHVSMPLVIKRMVKQAGCSANLFPTVEDLFSGRGFSKFCRQVGGVDMQKNMANFQPSEIFLRPEFSDAIELYASMLGQLLRELTLTYMPLGGVYLAGSVARAVMKTAPSVCLETFMRPCKIRGAERPGLSIIKDDFAALNGCAAYEV